MHAYAGQYMKILTPCLLDGLQLLCNLQCERFTSTRAPTSDMCTSAASTLTHQLQKPMSNLPVCGMGAYPHKHCMTCAHATVEHLPVTYDVSWALLSNTRAMSTACRVFTVMHNVVFTALSDCSWLLSTVQYVVAVLQQRFPVDPVTRQAPTQE